MKYSDQEREEKCFLSIVKKKVYKMKKKDSEQHCENV